MYLHACMHTITEILVHIEQLLHMRNPDQVH